MSRKPSYEELKQRVRELYEESVEHKRAQEELTETEVRFRHFLDVLGDLAHEERKRAEEALTESEEKYRTVLDACPDPVVVYDMEGRGVYVNPEFSRVFGWSSKEVLGKKPDYVPDENWPETQVMIDKVLAGESFSGVESRRYTKAGNILDVSISAATHLNHNGNPVGSVHILRDITD